MYHTFTLITSDGINCTRKRFCTDCDNISSDEFNLFCNQARYKLLAGETNVHV